MIECSFYISIQRSQTYIRFCITYAVERTSLYKLRNSKTYIDNIPAKEGKGMIIAEVLTL